jgi:hypothetical protein
VAGWRATIESSILFSFETVFGGRVNSPVPIDRSHDTASFDCGVAPLNEYLKNTLC